MTDFNWSSNHIVTNKGDRVADVTLHCGGSVTSMYDANGRSIGTVFTKTGCAHSEDGEQERDNGWPCYVIDREVEPEKTLAGVVSELDDKTLAEHFRSYDDLAMLYANELMKRGYDLYYLDGSKVDNVFEKIGEISKMKTIKETL